MLRKTLLISLALALAIALAGCGSKDTGASGTTEPGTTKSTEGTTPDAKADKGTETPDKGTQTPDKGKAPEPGTTDVKATGEKAATGTFKPKPASGDATKFKGTYSMYLSPEQVGINKKMVSKGKAPFEGEITIDGAGGYVFKFGPKGMQRVTKGTTQVAGSEITLSPATLDGKEPKAEGEQRPIQATLKDDGKTLILHLKSKAGGGDMKFTRK